MIRFDKQMKQNENPEKSQKISLKSRDQKYWEIPSRKIPGLKFLIPLGPAHITRSPEKKTIQHFVFNAH